MIIDSYILYLIKKKNVKDLLTILNLAKKSFIDYHQSFTHITQSKSVKWESYETLIEKQFKILKKKSKLFLNFFFIFLFFTFIFFYF